MCKLFYLPFTWECLLEAHGSELEAPHISSHVS